MLVAIAFIALFLVLCWLIPSSDVTRIVREINRDNLNRERLAQRQPGTFNAKRVASAAFLYALAGFAILGASYAYSLFQ